MASVRIRPRNRDTERRLVEAGVVGGWQCRHVWPVGLSDLHAGGRLYRRCPQCWYAEDRAEKRLERLEQRHDE